MPLSRVFLHIRFLCAVLPLRGFPSSRNALRMTAFLVAVGAVLWQAYAGAARQTSAKATWTLMVYMDADNSLETPQLVNIEEMLKIGSGGAVQIVMLCDRSPKSEPKDQSTSPSKASAWRASRRWNWVILSWNRLLCLPKEKRY